MPVAATGQPILRAENLHVRFGGVVALHNISVHVPGGILAIIGPNGAGKTTLINVINGVYHPSPGRIFLGEQDITQLSPHRIAGLGLARTFQNVTLFRGMSVLDNIMLGRQVYMRSGLLASGIYWGWAQREEIAHRAVVERIVDFLEISHIRTAAAGTLPYGLRKRVDLGRALAAEPRVLLLDEPMTGMNLEEKEDMARFILDVQEEWDTAIVLIEHDMGVVMDISQHIVVLDHGEKIAEGPPAEIRHNPDVIRAYLGEGPAPQQGRGKA
ncbi:MAG TPA: ABC transporter ATP-binding protein [bacterium]|nr:ABC transporter ATP-binding protein [bacterium]